jgi:hypothetical protein
VPSLRQWGTIAYFAIAMLIFLGYIYLGVAGEFTTSLDVGFVIVIWIFVVIAMKTGLVKVPPQARLPLTNLHAKFKVASLLRAVVCAVLAVVWVVFAGRVLFKSQFNDTWIGVVFAFGPFLGLLGLFVKFLMDGFKVTVGRR